MYSTPGCKWCSRARYILEAAKADYTELKVGVDISNSEVKETYPTSVGYPLILIDNVSHDVVSMTKLLIEKGMISTKNE